jgi:hypothetical protein
MAPHVRLPCTLAVGIFRHRDTTPAILAVPATSKVWWHHSPRHPMWIFIDTGEEGEDVVDAMRAAVPSAIE